MSTCTFFGHRDCPETLKPKLRSTIIDLIENHNVDMFYVGNQGQFDTMVRSTLKKLKQEYPHIDYAVVLAYMPGKPSEYEDYSDTIFPEGLETVHPRYAISWRNNWMLNHSGYVITYITHPYGGAAEYGSLAMQQGKHVLNLGVFMGEV